jgi:hypothetical protein
MAGGIGDTTKITLTSDEDENEEEEEGESEEDPHHQVLQALQQTPSGSVLVEHSQEVYVGPQLTYNGPVTVNQILHVTEVNRGYNEVSQPTLLRQGITAQASYSELLSSSSSSSNKNNKGREHQSKVNIFRNKYITQATFEVFTALESSSSGL